MSTWGILPSVNKYPRWSANRPNPSHLLRRRACGSGTSAVIYTDLDARRWCPAGWELGLAITDAGLSYPRRAPLCRDHRGCGQTEFVGDERERPPGVDRGDVPCVQGEQTLGDARRRSHTGRRLLDASSRRSASDIHMRSQRANEHNDQYFPRDHKGTDRLPGCHTRAIHTHRRTSLCSYPKFQTGMGAAGALLLSG